MKLYKYRTLDKNTFEIFGSAALWAAAPQSLNDPFECKPVLDEHVDVEELFRQLGSDIAFVFRGEPARAREERLAQLRILFRQDRKEFAAWIWEMYATRVNALGLVCASEVWDCELMWSHYADGHKGICFELETDLLVKGGTNPFHEVKYSKTRPMVRLGSDPRTVRERTTLSKSARWNYEREWRMVLEAPTQKEKLPDNVILPPEAFTGVLIGAHVSESTAALVKALGQRLNPSMIAYQMSLSADSYELRRAAF